MSDELRQVFFGVNETETPADLRDGERVEAIRLGGPRDGATVVVNSSTARFVSTEDGSRVGGVVIPARK